MEALFTDIASWAGIIIAGLTAIGITIEIIPPIKIKPISWILRKAGKTMNKDIEDKITDVSKDLSLLSEKFIDHEVDQLRWNILDFANACRHGRRRTKEEFDHVIEDHERYNRIIESNGLTNGQIDLDFQYIQKLYLKCCEDNDFL